VRGPLRRIAARRLEALDGRALGIPVGQSSEIVIAQGARRGLGGRLALDEDDAFRGLVEREIDVARIRLRRFDPDLPAGRDEGDQVGGGSASRASPPPPFDGSIRTCPLVAMTWISWASAGTLVEGSQATSPTIAIATQMATPTVRRGGPAEAFGVHSRARGSASASSRASLRSRAARSRAARSGPRPSHR